jgi:DNA primase catalytic subunit
MRTEDVMDISNIIACAPTWDIDNRLDDWKATVAAACEIISFLEKNGVEQSIIIKYSGRGIHVQIHPMAVSQELRRKTNPLDLAFATVEYVNSKIRQSLLDLKIQFKADALRVDNEMDTQRLFTCPLSLHKDLDKVCVCMSLDELENFTPEWGDPHSFKHNPSWDKFLAGEADRLASLAYSTVGGCPSIPKMRRRRHPPIDKQIVDLTSQLAEKHPPDAY